MQWCLAWILLGACSFGGAAGTPPDADLPADSDGSDDAGDDIDAGDDAPPPDAPPDGPFAAGCVVQWLNGPSFSDPVLEFGGANDQQDVFVTGDDARAFYQEELGLQLKQRNPGNGSWMDQPTPSGLGGPMNDVSKLTMTADGLTFVSTARNSSTFTIHTTQLTGDAFSAPSTNHLQAVNASGDDIYDPHISTDGLRLYFAPLANGRQTLKVANRGTVTADFGNVRDVPGLSRATGDDADPTLTADELVIVYLSDQSGGGLRYATRATRDGNFSSSVQFTDGQLGAVANSPHLSPDGCKLYFSSQLDSAPNEEIYSISIVP